MGDLNGDSGVDSNRIMADSGRNGVHQAHTCDRALAHAQCLGGGAVPFSNRDRDRNNPSISVILLVLEKG